MMRRIAMSLVAVAVRDPAVREPLLGDLHEEASEVEHAAGRGAATRWLWSQVIGSMPSLVVSGLARLGWREWVGATVAACGAYVATMLMVYAANWISSIAAGATAGTPIASGLVASAIVSVLASIAGGYFAAVLGRRSPFASAFVLGVLFFLIGAFLLVLGNPGMPLGYYAVLELTTIPATLAGAALRAHGRPARH